MALIKSSQKTIDFEGKTFTITATTGGGIKVSLPKGWRVGRYDEYPFGSKDARPILHMRPK